MTWFSIIVGIWFAYWWHFKRETRREREYREEQQRKRENYERNMNRFK